MTDQDGRRAQRETLQASKTSTKDDRSRPHEDLLARYLRLPAAQQRRAPKAGKKSTTPEGR